MKLAGLHFSLCSSLPLWLIFVTAATDLVAAM
jgi:hypothetical protein